MVLQGNQLFLVQFLRKKEVDAGFMNGACTPVFVMHNKSYYDNTWNASRLAPVAPEAIISTVNVYFRSDMKAVSLSFSILMETKCCLLHHGCLWKGGNERQILNDFCAL